MSISHEAVSRLTDMLRRLYGDKAESVLQQIQQLASRYPPSEARADSLWDERDVVLITYGDQIRSENGPSLEQLAEFLCDHDLNEVVNIVHVLPFCPYTSDDGFSVVDYRRIDPALGDWSHIGRLGENFGLMFDLVLNHCSVQHQWFQQFLQGDQGYESRFHVVDSDRDVTAVTRPRAHPLLTPFETPQGVRHVWTTFSADQVDWNFANPEVLFEFLDVLLFYTRQGARIIRLDAIAYLWKQIGTPCIHLEETHLVVKLMRLVLDELAPGTLLLTETNVPHAENVSYFGNGDEAHIVYQFSLAPLVLEALLTGDGGPFVDWLSNLDAPAALTTFLNFTASHDGIGVRPLEGLLSPRRIGGLVEAVRKRGGRVSSKRNPDGSESPYELNITYFSALGGEDEADPLHIDRFLASQALMLSVQGVPAVYFHSLIGTPNDLAGVEQTGRARSINRRKFTRSELEQMLSAPVHGKVFDAYKRMLKARVGQPAFHPDASQQVLDVENHALVAFNRRSVDGKQRVLVVANLSDQPQTFDLGPHEVAERADLLSNEKLATTGPLPLRPYQVRWIA